MSFFIIQLFGQPAYQNETIAPSIEQYAHDNCNLSISIPEDGCELGIQFPLPINGLSNNILGYDVELSEAQLIISHTWELDLRIYLRSPAGTRIPLSIENGTSADDTNYGDISVPNCEAYTSFTMDPCLSLNRIDDPSITSNFIGRFLPEGDFGAFNGEDPNGIWYLEICDKDAGANSGRLEFADLVFTELHCDAPRNVMVNSVNNSSITVSWDPIPNTTLTLIEVVPYGQAPSNGSTSLNGNIFQTNNLSSSTALELQEDTPYDVYVRTRCDNGLYSKNSCVVFIQTACETQAVTARNNFDFQSLCQSTCGQVCNINGLWNNVSYDDFDWFVGNWETPIFNSGPDDDITGGGKYIYVETNGLDCQFNKSAILESNCLQISANQNSCHMSFYFHSFGNSLGALKLEILPEGATDWISLWSSVGINDNNWLRNYVDLRFYNGQNVKMRFVASGATGNSSNLALDEITFYGALESGTPAFTHYRDFDNDGFGDGGAPLSLCSPVPPTGFVTNALDCNDLNPNVSPISTEVGCNGIDENCNGMNDDNMVEAPNAFYQEVCSGDDVRLEIFSSGEYETNWYADASGNTFIGSGNPFEVDLESGYQVFYAENVQRNGLGLRLTEVNFQSPYHLEMESIGQSQDYSGWKVYVNSVLNGSDINAYNTTPWELEQISTGYILTRIRTDWENPILWPNSRPGWVMLIDPEGKIRDAIFWNWSDSEFDNLSLNIEDRSYNRADIPWQGSAMNVSDCDGTISLSGNTETNSSEDYQCQLIGSIGEHNPALDYETVCGSNLVAVPVNSLQSPVVDYVLDNDPCDNGSVSSGIELLVHDGVGPFEYYWSNGSRSQNQNNLPPDDYNVTIVGGNGCNTILENITIGTNSASIELMTSEVQNASCFGAEDGQVIVEVNGGAPPFQFNWVVGIANNEVFVNRDTLTSLAEGQYAVTVTDNNGCVSSTQFVIGQPNPLTINVDAQLPTCQSSFDGTIQIETIGGNPPYDFEWSNGRTSSNNTNLSFGSYALTVTDDNDCVLVSEPIIFSPTTDTIVFLGVDIVQVECANGSAGSIETSFTGGVGTLSYFWDNGATTPILLDLEPGSYSLTVTDENQCEFYLSNVQIDQPLSNSISLNFNTDNTSCSGVCDGALSTSISGGEAPYTYAWSTGDSLASVFNLCEGAIGLTITDNAGCQTIFDNEIFIESEETSIQSLYSVDSITCFNSNDGIIDLNVIGGTAPYSYSWNLTDENGPIISDLIPGTYTCTVTDNMGCNFISDDISLARPDLIKVDSLIVENATAGGFDGAISLFISGGRENFTISWFDSDDLPIGMGPTIENIGLGNYSFVAADQGGCEFVRRNIVVELRTTPVKESSLLNSFELSPNPTSNFILLDAQLNTTLNLTMSVFNASGQLISHERIDDQQTIHQPIDVSTYPPGVYFIALWNDLEFIGRKSFVVQ